MKGLGPYSQGSGYLIGDVARLLTVTPRRVEGWIEQGFIKPAVRGKGPGRRNLFTREQVVLGALILELQANFGERSALVGMCFPNRAESLLKLAHQYAVENKQFIFGMSLKAGRMRELAPPDVGNSPELRSTFVTEALAKGYTVFFINVSAILARFFKETKHDADSPTLTVRAGSSIVPAGSPDRIEQKEVIAFGT